MAVIVGGVTTSHVPAIGAALDGGKAEEPYWKKVFDGFDVSKKWIEDTAPDVVVLVYNDHGTAFALDVVPTFAIGVADSYAPADEGWGPRPVPVIEGDAELGRHIAESLIFDEFDMTIINEMAVDHGLTVPLSLMCGQPDVWPFRVVPIPVNVVLYPPPTGKRCFDLGRAIRRAVESYEKDIKVSVWGTGGMSHQLHGERAGLINQKWDNAFLDKLIDNPATLLEMDHVEYMREAGAEAVELVMWLIMRGAMNDDVRLVHRFYHVPASNTAIGHLIIENR